MQLGILVSERFFAKTGRSTFMGLADRDYMKAGYRAEPHRQPKASWFKRFKFLLFRIRRALFKT